MNDSNPSASSPQSAHGHSAGQWIVQVNLVLTTVFVAAAIVAATVFDQPWKAVSVAVDIVCFAVGVVAFLWGYFSAVQRSRTDDISVAALYFLVDKVAPSRVTRVMNVLLAVQVIGGLATALARPSTDGKPGSTLAFGILVPMLGLGLNGLWGAHHGQFRPRPDAVPHESGSSGQDDGHE